MVKRRDIIARLDSGKVLFLRNDKVKENTVSFNSPENHEFEDLD